mgnify:FL=1
MIPKRFEKEFGNLRKTTWKDIRPGVFIIDFCSFFNDFDGAELPTRFELSVYYYLVGTLSREISPQPTSYPQGIWNIVELEDRDGCYPVGKEAYTSFLNDDHTYVIGEGWND